MLDSTKIFGTLNTLSRGRSIVEMRNVNTFYLCLLWIACNVRFWTDSHVLYIDKIIYLENVDTIKIEILHIQ